MPAWARVCFPPSEHSPMLLPNINTLTIPVEDRTTRLESVECPFPDVKEPGHR